MIHAFQALFLVRRVSVGTLSGHGVASGSRQKPVQQTAATTDGLMIDIHRWTAA
ncbi:hypothetical protein JK361_40000 [Streptomyces sp. 5-8]|uniref:Integrase n=1 Tax=Streptomyces musisoli TaxID=2802280 RepID=A0ABS1PE48_9ACTN|nr:MULTISPECIES: hypothetical protein [Streptomyces]MBL1110653.1 hypothetical protein [Streptomyces musisoli]MBY8842868.1 hypothetical protein [Streptomyces sp. SP2-10]